MRTVQFAIIGALAAITGEVELILFVSLLRVDKNLAFALQTIISLQLIFALSSFFTWRGRKGSFVGKWIKFHLGRVVTVVASGILFSLFISAFIPYYIANLMCILLVMAANFIWSEHVVFSKPAEVVVESEALG